LIRRATRDDGKDASDRESTPQPTLVTARHPGIIRACRPGELLNNDVTQAVWLPGVGFRSANALRMPQRTIVRQGERALAVVLLVSSELGTELSFEIKDDPLEDDCLAGKFDHRALMELDVTLRDESGRDYARSHVLHEGIGLGQHEFGFFQRRLGFEPLRADARRVVLEVDGALGTWSVPVDLRPIAETGAAIQRTVDRATTKHGVSVRLIGIAMSHAEAVVEVDATWSPPIAAVRAIGALMQRQGNDRLVLSDDQGNHHDEELSRESSQRPRESAAHTIAKFPALSPHAMELRLVVPSVVVEESDATLVFELPMAEEREVLFGPYPMRLGPASLAHDLPEVPGQPPGYGLRFALGPTAWHEDRRAVRPSRRDTQEGHARAPDREHPRTMGDPLPAARLSRSMRRASSAG
jgi:hypothetical protein